MCHSGGAGTKLTVKNIDFHYFSMLALLLMTVLRPCSSAGDTLEEVAYCMPIETRAVPAAEHEGRGPGGDSPGQSEG